MPGCFADECCELNGVVRYPKTGSTFGAVINRAMAKVKGADVRGLFWFAWSSSIGSEGAEAPVCHRAVRKGPLSGLNFFFVVFLGWEDV